MIKSMTDRIKFIKKLLTRLKEYQYVLLKHIDDSVEDMSEHCDLDFLFSKNDFNTLLDSMKAFENIKKVVCKNQSTMSQVFIFFKDESYLQLDFLFGFYRKDIEYLNQKEVLEFSICNTEGIQICNNRHLFEHLLLFNFLNFSGIPEKYLEYFSKLSPEESNNILNYLNSKYKFQINRFDGLKEFDPSIRNVLLEYLSEKPQNQRVVRLKNRLKYSFDLLKSVFSNRGFIMTFSGVDGAGKTTIIKNVKEKLEQKYRRNVIVLRHRPSLFPILSAFQYGKENAEKRTMQTLPRQGKNKSTLSSLIRFTYYYFDYLIGHFYVKARYVWRGYVVIYDRYYFDFIVDGKRSNIQLSQSIPKFLFRFVSKPALNLFLYAKPETILNRKKELDLDSINELTTNYKSLFEALKQESRNNKYLPIENINQEKTLNQIIEQYEALI